MSSPFSSISPTGQFVWTLQPTSSAQFTVINPLGIINVIEVGFGEEGFGEGGFDTPSLTIPSSAIPTWSIVSVK